MGAGWGQTSYRVVDASGVEKVSGNGVGTMGGVGGGSFACDNTGVVTSEAFTVTCAALPTRRAHVVVSPSKLSTGTVKLSGIGGGVAVRTVKCGRPSLTSPPWCPGWREPERLGHVDSVCR